MSLSRDSTSPAPTTCIVRRPNLEPDVPVHQNPEFWARDGSFRGGNRGIDGQAENAIMEMASILMDDFVKVLAVDLLNPSPAAEARKHKLKTLVPAPRSFFMDVKCPGCFTITTVFSHAQTVVICQGCTTVLCQPTGGKARLTEGCSFRRK
ncbi:hypothetical protein VTH82DRAFT_7960 [Thermothelomyces myriococcoides]